jgi:two-component system chemotaxis response regulator CheB
LDARAQKKISVLVVDDSALVRQLLADMISNDPELEVAGLARNGVEAIKLMQELDPAVITMDIHMPELDGLSALEYIMKKSPRPVVMLSALVRQGAVPTLKALELGAVDFIAKPSQFPTSVSLIGEEVVAKIKAAAGVQVRMVQERERRAKPPRKLKLNKEGLEGGKVVVLGASAGGPKALAELLPAMPEDLPARMVIVQHMPGPFSGPFAKRLNYKSRMTVRQAADEEVLKEGEALVVPGDSDMVFEKVHEGRIRSRLLPTVARHGASPVIDVTMESAARVFGDRTIGVLLTGMGSDGAMGLGMIRDAGGYTIAQDEATSMVFGMPKAAIDMELASEVLPIDRIAERVVSLL